MMAFEENYPEDYSSYYTPYQDYSSYGDPNAESDYYSQPEPYVPPVTYPSDPYAGDAYYTPVPEPEVSPSYIPDWLKTAGKGLASYAANNPKDILGMGIGAGMGLYGLATSPNPQKAPNLATNNAANAAIQAQLQSTQGLNADAVAKLRAQIGGDYGDYADAAGARSGATAKLQQLLQNGPDYTMLPEEQRALAELDQKWAAKGMLGSSLHNAEAQALKDSFRNNALARYQSEVKSLSDTAANFSNQTSQQFQNTGNVVNQGQNTAIQGLSNLAASGIQAAKLGSDVQANNQKLAADRSNQLLKTGGEIFGQSYSNPADTIKKIKSLG